MILVIFLRWAGGIIDILLKMRLNGLTKWFKSLFIYAPHRFEFGAVAQLVRASDCRSEG